MPVICRAALVAALCGRGAGPQWSAWIRARSGPLAERGLTVSSCFRKRSQFELAYFVFTRKQQKHNKMRESKCFCINEEMERTAHTCSDSKKAGHTQEHMAAGGVDGRERPEPRGVAHSQPRHRFQRRDLEE